MRAQVLEPSRLEQREVVPEHIPPFRLVDPFAPDALELLDLGYPFWLKPVKSFGSHLGFRVRDPGDFRGALTAIRAELPRLAEPFDYLLGLADLPPEVAAAGGYHCVAEGLIGGRQCTLEGAVFGGEIRIHGVVDSVRYPNRSSFARYQLPSGLPRSVRERMAGVLARLLARVGLDDSGFNAEFFWDRPRDRIWLLEVNTRIAQHHSDLFEKVTGVSNHRVPVRLALGKEPSMPRKGGPFRCAAVFFLRRFRDGVVTAVPGQARIRELEAAHPGAVVKLQVAAGTRLSELREQDSYSYVLAMVYMGAQSQRELLAGYRRVVRGLEFRVDDVPGEEGR